jgi:hypothetical protein
VLPPRAKEKKIHHKKKKQIRPNKQTTNEKPSNIRPISDKSILF